MIKFVHTADWQLGMTRHFLHGEAQARFDAARLEAVGTIGGMAAAEGCAFVVVCGDVFESNQVDRKVLLRALEKMRANPEVDFYLLPGNHDPLDASSIFGHRTFADNKPDNVKVLQGSEPLRAAPGVELVPAPWTSKRPLTDLVNDACKELDPTGAVRIVVGHGAVAAYGAVAGHAGGGGRCTVTGRAQPGARLAGKAPGEDRGRADPLRGARRPPLDH